MYLLTKEGKNYLENGFPEINLMHLLGKGSFSIEDARKRVPDFSIALQWAKKNGWIEIKDCVLYKKKVDVVDKLSDYLKSLDNGDDVPENIVALFLQRKLIEKERENILKRAEKLVGSEVAFLTEDIIKTGAWKKIRFREYNVTVPGNRIYPGKKHPYGSYLSWVKRKLVALGFEEMEGPLVETEFWNMDALYMPQHHSARDIHDAYFIKEPSHAENIDKRILKAVKDSHEKGVSGSRGWEYKYDVKRAHRHILRTHGTVLSAKTLVSKPKIPGRYFSVMRCFRYDVVDATHLPDFFQVEGIVLENGINICNLIGILKLFAREFANTENIKIVPSYFPFTEPSLELQAKHPELGWLELGGAGIFRKEVTLPLGVDVPVLAWGLGIDRIAMLNLGISDIRDLFSTNLEYLRNSRVVY